MRTFSRTMVYAALGVLTLVIRTPVYAIVPAIPGNDPIGITKSASEINVYTSHVNPADAASLNRTKANARFWTSEQVYALMRPTYDTNDELRPHYTKHPLLELD